MTSPVSLSLATLDLPASPFLCVGIDIGKFHHAVGFLSSALLARFGHLSLCPAITLEPNREHIDLLLTQIQAAFPLAQCAILLEHTGHYHRALEEILLAAGCAVYVISIHERRRGLDKTDTRDALRLAGLLYDSLVLGATSADPLLHPRRLYPPTEEAARLRVLVRRRYELVQDCTRHKNKLTALADEIFPEFTRVFRDPNLPTALDLRARFPTPAAIAAASLQDLHVCRRLLHRRYYPSDTQFAELQALARRSIGITAQARLSGLILEQSQLIAELQLLARHREALEAAISPIVAGSRAGQILRSFGCIGVIEAASMLAAIGTIKNFESAARLKKFFGWAPVQQQTGVSFDRASLTPAGAQLMKQTLYLVALNAVRLPGEWQRLYERLVPLKCSFNARTGRYQGKRRVLGRVAGDLIALIYLLLSRDHLRIEQTPAGETPPAPVLYDATVHAQEGRRAN